MYETEIARIKVLKVDLETNRADLEANRAAEQVIRDNRRTIKEELDSLIATISA